MKKVFFAAVLAVTVLGGSYASESAMGELQSAVSPAALENAAPPAPAVVKVVEQPGTISAMPIPAMHKPGAMLSIEMFPGDTPYDELMVEAYRRLKSGAVSSDIEKDRKSYRSLDYRLLSYWTARGDSDPKTFNVVEMFPKGMRSIQYVMGEAYLRTKDGAKEVDVVAGDEKIILLSKWEVAK